MDFMLPNAGVYRHTNCACGGAECRKLKKRFAKINDIRGGFFAIPSNDRTRGARAKRDTIVSVFGLRTLSNKLFIAVHHFSPVDLRRKCMGRRGYKHVYRWPTGIGGMLEVVPNYSLKEATDDCTRAEEETKRRPTYTKNSRRNTEEMLVLYLKKKDRILTAESDEKQKQCPRETKRLTDFCYFVRQQVKKGRLLPLEKLARLEQVGFAFE